MSLAKLVPAWMHGIGDYGAGILVLLAAIIAGNTTGAVATGVVLGAALLVVSLFTRYPLGAVKAIPFPMHSAGDYGGAILLIVAPFALHFDNTNRGLSSLYVVVGVVVLLLSLVTNYSDPETRTNLVTDSSSRPRAHESVR
jgi:hypothetical protein